MMAKHRQKNSQKKQENQISLKDQLNSDLVKQLQAKKHALAKREEQRIEEEQKEKERARKEKEKNKSFEELFNESDLKWNEFK
ncbi:MULTISPECIES: YqkE family protein [Bacillaceae]|nr:MULTISPECIES: YqkE family protein [Bacillaceae]SCB81884.1 Protein of unknown function [Priestia flexa]